MKIINTIMTLLIKLNTIQSIMLYVFNRMLEFIILISVVTTDV